MVHIVSAPSVLEIRVEGNTFTTRHSLEMKIIFFDERCVCVCVCVGVCVCVCGCGCVGGCVGVGVHVYVTEKIGSVWTNCVCV